MIDEKKLIEFIKSNDFKRRIIQSKDSIQDILVQFIIEQPKVGEWIPCSERLPEEYGSYLVAWKPLMMFDRMHQHYYEIVEFDPDDEALWIGNIEQAHGKYEIIAWQPLPEPYKGE